MSFIVDVGAQVRSLVSLRCNVSPAWAERVLLQAAPQLESLVVEAPGRQHLHVIGGMARLRRLCITSTVSDAALPLHLEELYLTKTVTQEQLARVSMLKLWAFSRRDCPSFEASLSNHLNSDFCFRAGLMPLTQYQF